MTRMMEPGDWNHRTKLVSPSEAEAVIAAIEARREVKMPAERAVNAAQMFMGLFPAKSFNDPKIFVTALSALFAAYDPEFVNRISSPIDGLATRLKFAVSLADVKEALEAERNKRLSILSVAKWTLREHKRRAEEEEMRETKLSPEEAERRRRQVAALLGPKDLEHDAPVHLETDAPAPSPSHNPPGQ